MKPRTTAVAAAVLLSVAACDPSGPDVGPPAQLDIVAASGDAMTGDTVPVTVTVLDSRSRPVDNAAVTFNPSGSGSVDPAADSTDVDGQVSVLWTLGNLAGTQTLTVKSGAAFAELSLLVSGPNQLALAVGESVTLLSEQVAWNQLTEDGTYVISVFNTSTSAAVATGFRLKGTASAPAAGLDRSRLDVRPSRPAPIDDPELDGHLRTLERNRRLVRQLGPPDGAIRARAGTSAEVVGDLRTFRIPDLEASNSCSSYIEVTARAVYAGTHGVIWEDTLAPLAGTMDAVWDTVGTEYDGVMHQILLDYFGDPLVYDDRLDNNGLFYMLFSKKINDFTDPAVSGFVFSGDFYTRSLCSSSDHGEIFYGRVPTVADTDGYRYDPGEIGDWRWRMRSTIIHEVKHLTAYANKFDVGPGSPNIEETGLEEATARLAEEFFARAVEGYGQRDNVTYQESIWCERRVGAGNPDCDRVPLIMGKHYAGVNEYLKTPALLSPFGRVDASDNSFYGSGWQWVRWAIDQSDLSEASIIKPLIREPTLTGAANLADKVGDRSVAELLGDYTLAFATDDAPGFSPARAELTMPSWDTRDIFQGLYDDYAGTSQAGTYPTPWPLEPTGLSGGDFQVDVDEIHGGGAAIFELSGVSTTQTLELLSTSGGTAPGTLGLAIVRIQ